MSRTVPGRRMRVTLKAHRKRGRRPARVRRVVFLRRAASRRLRHRTVSRHFRMCALKQG